MKNWRTTTIGIGVAVLTVTDIILLVTNLVTLPEFSAILGGIGTTAGTLIGIFAADGKQSEPQQPK